MAQYTAKTINSILKEIEIGKIILPAMQRNFVWAEEKIQDLFDSLMHDYPIGTFLFWEIDEQIFNNYTFNTFIKDVNEKYRDYQRGEKATAQRSEYQAVLDGQQRITSFYIGLKGSWRTHIKRAKWDDEASYYFRYFCINVLQKRESDDENYEFRFINETDIGKPIIEDSEEKFWVKIQDIIDEKGKKADVYVDKLIEDFSDIFSGTKGNDARVILRKLNNAICDLSNVHYYPATEKSLSEVGEIFVRVNNGGQKLSYSDLMLSIATGNMDGEDIHEKIQDKIQYINSKANEDTGFKVDKELILTAGLMFTNAKSLSLRATDNYKPEQMKTIFEDQWEGITDSLAAAVEYIEYLGFAGNKLTSKNLILPIAYYFYANGLKISKEKGANARAVCDFIFIRQWLLRAMIVSLFSDAIGNTLLKIRNHITSSNKYLPLDVLMKENIKKSLAVGEEEIASILEYKKGDARVIPLLMELAHDNTQRKYDADHIWPQVSISTDKAVRKNYQSASDDEIKLFKNYCDRLPNIELLDPGINKSKNDTLFETWIDNNPQQQSYYDNNCIPQNISYAYKDFLLFIKRRTEILEQRIKDAFPDEFDAIVTRYSLKDKIKNL